MEISSQIKSILEFGQTLKNNLAFKSESKSMIKSGLKSGVKSIIKSEIKSMKLKTSDLEIIGDQIMNQVQVWNQVNIQILNQVWSQINEIKNK